MFTDSVWQSQGSDSHRGWITLASFTVQTLAVATLLVLPLLHTEGLPPMHSVVEPVFSPPLAGGTSEIRPPRSQLGNLANATLVVPRPTSHEIHVIPTESSRPQLDVIPFGVPGGTLLERIGAVDLSPFGLDNPNEIFVATEQPYGLIEARISRK